jgi:hypothetical protein
MCGPKFCSMRITQDVRELAEEAENEADIYNGLVCRDQDDEFLKYVEKITALKATRIQELEFFFGHFEDQHPDIAVDAFKVFASSTYADLRRASRIYDQKKLEGWIGDKAVPDYRKDLYKVLLALSRSVQKP